METASVLAPYLHRIALYLHCTCTVPASYLRRTCTVPAPYLHRTGTVLASYLTRTCPLLALPVSSRVFCGSSNPLPRGGGGGGSWPATVTVGAGNPLPRYVFEVFFLSGWSGFG